MTSIRRLARLSFVALIGAGPACPSPARAEPVDERLAVAFEDGAQAPSHGWTQEDGCPARTGASAARPLRGDLERAWKATAKEGTFEGEPLAWKDRVFVVEQGKTRRLLRVLAASTGTERARYGVESASPLFPSVGEGRVLLKTSPTTVEALTVGEAVLAPRWRITAKEGIGAATLLRDEVYVVRDGVLERWAFGASAPTWPRSPDAPGAVRVERDPLPGGAAGPPRFPRPSLRGGSIFVTSGGELVEVDRASGAVRGRASFPGVVDPERSRVVVTALDAFVRRGMPPGAGTDDTAWFGRSSPGSYDPHVGLSLPAGLAAAGRAWVGVVEDGKARRLCGFRGGQGEAPYVFAGDGVHDEFTAPTPPTYVPGAVYVGLRAFAVPSLTVLRSPATAVVSRAVPLRDRLLVLESATVLSSWRAIRRGDDRLVVRPPSMPAGSSAPVALKGCRAALEDGRVLEGPFTYDPKANVFKSSKAGELPSGPARTVHAVLTCDVPRKLVFAFRPAEAAAGVAAIARAEASKELLALVPAAVAAGDAELARRILGSAVEGGASDAEVSPIDAAIVTLEATPRPKDESKAAEAATRFGALLHREADALVAVAEAMPKDAPADVGVALVRAAVEREPQHEGATRWVRSRLPKELPVVEPLRLDDWLDFIEVRGRLKVRVWGMGKDNTTIWGSDADKPSDGSHLFNDFWSARSMWPGEVDMVAFQCGPLVVFSPLERPGAIVRCLALGRLVSDTLDKVFEPIAKPRTDSEELILHLYSNKEQYLQQSRPTGEADRGGGDGLENTAGHYSPSDNVTRMFFPGDEEGDLEMYGTYAHELTHHWIERRRPMPGGEDSSDRSSSTPGYWVVEGFADFVRGFVFDLEAQRGTAENARADYADCLAGIAPESLIPWSKHLTLTQGEFAKLSMEDAVPVPRRWRLGPNGMTVPKVLFYDQGAAVCAYLYLAEKEKHRKALLDFVYAYYAGKAKADTLERSTGLTPDELGKRVVAWCKDLVKRG